MSLFRIERPQVIALIVACALFMENFDGTVLATALPQIARSFGTDPVQLSLANQSQTPMHVNRRFAVGYDDADQRFLVRNSWGEQWGMNGYFTMPYAYLTDRSLASDFWAILQLEG